MALHNDNHNRFLRMSDRTMDPREGSGIFQIGFDCDWIQNDSFLKRTKRVMKKNFSCSDTPNNFIDMVCKWVILDKFLPTEDN